jgi:2-C-methyl-D-erythritol 4-phosphate cytidylyltransferase
MSTASKIIVFIPAGGVGARAGGELPKQYQRINGSSVLTHTLRAFALVPRVSATFVGVSAEDTLINQLNVDTPLFEILRCGGETRAHTVLNGLRDLRRRYDEGTWVLVHDAARCCVLPGEIERLIDVCIHHPVGGLLAVPASDTLKRANDQVESAQTLSRANVWYAQTPQMFRLGALLRALESVDLSEVTDEASAMERAGHAPKLVMGASTNLKVTYPEDFALARALLLARA